VSKTAMTIGDFEDYERARMSVSGQMDFLATALVDSVAYALAKEQRTICGAKPGAERLEIRVTRPRGLSLTFECWTVPA